MEATMAPQQPPVTEPVSRYVTVREFAAHWGVSERTVWRDIEKGAIPTVSIGPLRVRILRVVMEGYGKPRL